MEQNSNSTSRCRWSVEVDFSSGTKHRLGITVSELKDFMNNHPELIANVQADGVAFKYIVPFVKHKYSDRIHTITSIGIKTNGK